MRTRETTLNHIPFELHGRVATSSTTAPDRGDRLRIQANPDHAGESQQSERLELRSYRAAIRHRILLRTRETDVPTISRSRSSRRYGDRRHPNDTCARRNRWIAVLFNTTDPLTADARVRHALAEAIIAAVRKSYAGVPDAAAGVFQWSIHRPIRPYAPDNARRLTLRDGSPEPHGIR